MKWYKDRDFPEVKLSNADILAVIERPKELERVIQLQNELVDKLWLAEAQVDILKKRIAQLETIKVEVDYLDEKLLDRQCHGSLESRSGLMGMRYAVENIQYILQGKEKPYGGKG